MAARPPRTTTVEIAAIAWPRRSRARRRRALGAAVGVASAGQAAATRAPARWSPRSSTPPRSRRAHRIELSSSIANETQSVSGESFCSRAPHWSPPGRRELADDGRLGTCAAVRKKAVGTSTTTASTWPFLRAETTSLEVSKTCGVVGRLRSTRRPPRGWSSRSGRRCWRPARSASEVDVRGVGVLQRHDGLLGLVVGRGEVDLLGALRRDRDLVDVEVEVLRPRRVGGVERLHHPLDVVLARSRAGRRPHRRRRSRSPRRWSGRRPRSRAGRRGCRWRP